MSHAMFFEVRILKSKKKNVHGYFVSSFVLEHHGCTGHSKPTCRQISEVQAARAAVTANPKTPALSLISQIQQTNAMTCGKTMMYRAQAAIREENLGEYEENFKKLPSLLETFCQQNPGSHQVFECDHEGRYKRAFLSNPIVSRHMQHGQHGNYREIMLILVGCTGNNTNIVLAVALCKSEDEENCRWFLENAKKAGIKFDGVPVFSDRGRGLLSAFEGSDLGCIVRYCTRHIVGNILKTFSGCVPPDLKTMVYRIQAADTREEFASHLDNLAHTHANIAKYIEDIPADRWLMYAAVVKSTKMYGWRTTNFVESANGAAIPSRLKFPFNFSRITWTSLWIKHLSVKNKAKKNAIKEQQKLAGTFTVHRKTSSVAFVRSSRGCPVQHRVDLDLKMCTCSYMQQMGLPCRHFIAALIKCERLHELYDACDTCYLVKNFLMGYGYGSQDGVELMLDEKIVPRNVLPPLKTLNTVGRTKTKRIRSHQELPVANSSTKLRKCTLCGEMGHNKRSCANN
ncbi:hypothetical protein AeRB84_021733 [Aphanomyces euteiches]|nr:hypothetical protein AeRB84_021733 [Aphanomyces euteiches]